MAMPSAELMASWVEEAVPLSTVAAWAKLPDELANSFYEALGTDGDEEFAGLSFISDEEVDEAIDSLLVDDAPIKSMAKSKLRRFIAAIRKATGMEEKRAPGTPPAPIIIKPDSDDKTEKVSLGTVILQGSDVKIPLLVQELLDAAHLAYKKRQGKPPATEREPTDEQITCFVYMVNERNSAYADLAIFVPFGSRLAKSIRMHGQRVGPDGEIYVLEIYGPPNIDEWCRCWHIFRTCAIMYDIISVELLDQYEAMIRQFVGWYPKCWALIYQTEARTRSEHAPRVRRMLAEQKTEALKKNQDHPYDPLRPWDEVYNHLIHHSDTWWRRELEQPCTFITTGVSTLREHVGTDAPVKSSGSATTTTTHVEPPPKRPASPPPVAHADDRVHSTNGKGTPLCQGWQTGKCCKLGKGSRCSSDGISAHQCNICLGNDHGAHKCRNKTSAKKHRRAYRK